MILSDTQIRNRCIKGLIDPYRSENVQPASIDVTLGTRFRVFDASEIVAIDLSDPVDITRMIECSEPASSMIIHPGEFVLGHTEEKVKMPHDLVARIEGKSSLGRLGLIVHATAGFIDPGFEGRITLEMTNLLRVPIILRPGKLIGQLSFHLMSQPAAKPYAGRYQGDADVSASRYGQ